MSVTSAASAITTGVRNDAGSAYANAAHSKTVTADPQVPGPGRIRPIPKKVATRVAHAGGFMRFS